MRFFTRSLMGVFLAAVTLALLGLAALTIVRAGADGREGRTAPGSGPSDAAEEQLFSASIVTVNPARLTPVMTAYGEIRARRTLQLRSGVGGTVVDVAPGFEEGAAITEGTLLIRLDPADATSARDLAQATLIEDLADADAATADLAFARDDLAAAERQFALRQAALTRQEDLRSRGLGSDAATEEASLALSSVEQAVLGRRQAVLQAEARVAQAASTIARARIGLADAERNLRDTTILAPFDGRLTQVSVTLGALVSPNEVLAEIIDPAALEVMIRLSASQAAQLPPLDAAPTLFTVTTGLPGAAVAGQGILTREGASVGTGESGRVVFGALQQATGLLPGDFVTVALREPPMDDVALIPAAALGPDGTVLALDPQDRLEAVPVSLLRRQGNDVIIAAGSLAGRSIVAERAPQLGTGIRIIPNLPGHVRLTEDRRAELIALVEETVTAPDEKAALLEQLAQRQVPVALIARLEPPVEG